MKFVLTLISCLFAIPLLQAQTAGFWADVDASRLVLPADSEVAVHPSRYRTLVLDYEGFKNALRQAPLEFTAAAAAAPVEISLPLPDGNLHRFRVVESPVMAPELAARFPGIKSFQAYSLENPLVSARFDYSVKGMVASILSPQGRIFIEPYATKQTAYYVSYFARDLREDNLPPFSCGYDDFAEDALLREEMLLESEIAVSFRNNDLVPLRTYRLALACTGEYAQQKGGTLEAVQATFNTAVNLVNQIFQVENAVRLELVPHNHLLIFLDPATDPYQNANNGGSLLNQNTAVINSIIPPQFYDLGHVFTSGCTDVGGVAGGTICSVNKARGVTCHYTNNLTLIVTRVMAHEIGHQFAVGHSWNNCPGSEGQLASDSAYEPGSGSTIMSYQGSCPNNNISGPAGVYLNIGSLQTFIFFARQGSGSLCGETSTPGNNMPVVTLPYTNGFHIPISTPFELTAEAYDPDGDELTYCWEQFDLGPSSNLGSPLLDAPIFRSFNATSSPTRVFPRLNKIIGNNFDNEEVLPTYSRNLTFRCVVRDNNPVAGGTVWAEVRFRSDETAGPFVVLHPNVDTVRWRVGEYQEVRWDVANTDNNRVKCNFVNIKLSVDGGQTYPHTLLAGTPNAGSAFVTVPDALTSAARIRVEAADNIFFDISDRNFRIEEAIDPGYVLQATPAAIPLYCLPGSGPLAFNIVSTPILGYDSAITLSLLGELPASASYSFGQEQLRPGESTTLSIDLGDFVGRDTLELQVQAAAPGLDTAFRNLYVIALSSDFSALALQEPVDGTSGILFSTDFNWSPSPSAETYDFELATNPSFGTATVNRTNGLAQTAYTPNAFLESNQLYYWRVRPTNDCGPGDWLDPFAFQTATVDCDMQNAVDLPVSLANSVNTKISRIFVPVSGTISDLNIKNLEVTFQPVNSLRITLISPAGTEAILYNRQCLNTGLIRLAFDDEAPGGITCPPSSGNPTRPVEPLSIFDGENTFGEWQLRVQVVASGFGGGGSIQKWSLEFCASLSPTPPVTLRNELFRVPPGQSNTITQDFLETADDNAAAEQLIYTLVRPPAHGQLYRWAQNEPLRAGSKFSQATINTFNLVYAHDGSDTQADSFTFVVQDEEGGWIPTQVFNIAIDESALVYAPEIAVLNELRLFPNPASEQVTLTFQQPISGTAEVRFLNLQGQQVLQGRFAEGSGGWQMSTAALPAGIYFVHVQTAQGRYVQKLAIQR